MGKQLRILLVVVLFILVACAVTIPPVFRGLLIPGMKIIPTATATVRPTMTRYKGSATPYIFITPPTQFRPTRTPEPR